MAQAADSHLFSETVSPAANSHINTASVSLPPHINIDTRNTRNSKSRGFLNHETADFAFISPVREVHEWNHIQTYINMARAIQESGVPNYKLVRFPLQSGLNIEAFPLSL